MITLMSWGHKFGKPEANFIFDVSFLKNPWREGLKDRKAIIQYMVEQKEFDKLIFYFIKIIECYNEFYPNENLVFAFCCSAGEYRSPVVVEILGDLLKEYKVPHKIIQNKYSKL